MVFGCTYRTMVITRLTIRSIFRGILLKTLLDMRAPEDVYIGKTFSSREGVKLTGTMPGFKAGDSAAVTDSKLWGIGTTSGVWMYIPKDGWYSNKYWLQVPWGTLKNFHGNADASRV